MTAHNSAEAQQIWFGMRGTAQDWRGVRGHDDWDRLFFRAQPEWPPSLNDVSVVQVTTQTLSLIIDDELSKAVTKLHERKIALAVEMLAQAYRANCGQDVEGYANPWQTAAIAAKLKRAGGELRYAAMDEPLWFGHYSREKNACQAAISDIATGVAENIAEYRKVFPGLEAGDVEPVPALTRQPNWQSDFRAWMQTFRSATGKPLAFLHADVDWDDRGWREGLRAIARFSKEAGLPFGIIYNASPHARDDADWLEQANRNFVEIEGDLRELPDQVIFESWIRFPAHGVTAAGERGEDYLLEQYQRWQSQRPAAPGHRNGG